MCQADTAAETPVPELGFSDQDDEEAIMKDLREVELSIGNSPTDNGKCC